MTTNAKKIGIGVIGCGTIADVYLTNITQHYKNVQLLAVADMFAEKARGVAEKFHIPKACSVEELLADPEIQIVLNLTIPAAHYSVNKQILASGKHVYCEKPLAMTLSEANDLVSMAADRNLMCTAAPDTFLGSGIQECRSLLDFGRIGRPIGFTANLTCAGHELWHPNPGFYYKAGGGPMFDMGPYYLTALVYLLGPIKEVFCFATSGRPLRDILGKMTPTEIPTTYTGTIKFECGAIGTITMSFDTWKTSLPCLEIYGTEGSLTVPDPNQFGGPIRVFDGNELKHIVAAVTEPHPAKLFTMIEKQDTCEKEVENEVPHSEDSMLNMRGLGVSDMAQALLEQRPTRMSAEMSVHVVEALNAFNRSASTGVPYTMTTTFTKTLPMAKDWALWEIR